MAVPGTRGPPSPWAALSFRHAPRYISSVAIRAKYNEGRLNDSDGALRPRPGPLLSDRGDAAKVTVQVGAPPDALKDLS